MIITRHGHKRMKERLGLPKRAHSRHIKSALKKGSLKARQRMEKFEMVYHGFLYIFALTSSLEPVLVTAYPVRFSEQTR